LQRLERRVEREVELSVEDIGVLVGLDRPI
jgi:hypothetical protein